MVFGMARLLFIFVYEFKGVVKRSTRIKLILLFKRSPFFGTLYVTETALTSSLIRVSFLWGYSLAQGKSIKNGPKSMLL